MMEERPDRRQARITCLDRVLPLLLKLVQKRENEIAVQILGRQCARLAPGALGGEEDEHAQGVAVAGDRRGARVPLLGQPVAEERLQQRRERWMCAHETPPSAKARSAAIPNRSAVALT